MASEPHWGPLRLLLFLSLYSEMGAHVRAPSEVSSYCPIRCGLRGGLEGIFWLILSSLCLMDRSEVSTVYCFFMIFKVKLLV